jgi:hypothetical protein
LLSQSRFVLEIVNQASLYACVPREISVPTELALGHLRCCVTDMPPQPNSPSGRCLETRLLNSRKNPICAQFSTVGSSQGSEERRLLQQATAVSRESGLPPIFPNLDGDRPEDKSNLWSLHSISEATFRVVVFHLCLRFHLYYTSDVAAQSQTGVKLNRVFFPRLALQVRSLDCRFAR